MALPLLAIKPAAIAARVSSFGADDDRRDLDIQIDQAYRQIFFHAFKVDRDAVLESQLRSGQITVRDFVRGLLLSRKFRDDFYRVNSNYRMVEQIVGRVLGRPVHGDAERIAYSIMIAEQGLPALVDRLLNSQEYLDAFGYDTVPFQRSRVLPGQAVGTLPFNQQAPRYDGYWREVAARRAPVPPFSGRWTGRRPAWLADAPAPWARRLWQNTVAAGGFALTGLVIWTAVAMLSTAR